MFQKLIKEPILHFLVLGAMLFLLAGKRQEIGSPQNHKIVVTSSQIENLAIGFSRTWMRPPTQEELKGLVDDFVREEVMYREAVSVGLDRDDTIVRRRLRQKLEFITENSAAQSGSPTIEQLQDYLDKHQDQYRESPTITFEQLYYDAQKRRSAMADAQSVLSKLNGAGCERADIASLGDPFLLPFKFEKQTAGEIAQTFGDGFGKQVAQLAPGKWVGPIESSYGLHLVRVDAITPGDLLPIATIHDQVLRDLMNERRRLALDDAYAKLQQRYTVVFEKNTPITIAERP